MNNELRPPEVKPNEAIITYIMNAFKGLTFMLRSYLGKRTAANGKRADLLGRKSSTAIPQAPCRLTLWSYHATYEIVGPVLSCYLRRRLINRPIMVTQ
uniref:Uncharacterized protein n=1 Tax=Picea glauca TaxID=3330 RepID=A0A101LWM5_PICGL|nr:hypothetical protein ABT39_MTgene1614 [Picea glauca]QHR86557.1 hypothetical protein Q903MT_gene559 [Picea sitchensis]